MRILKISKVISFLIGIMMMAFILCYCSQVQAVQVGNYTYTVVDGQAQITKYTGAGGAVTIPNTLGGVPVTSIGNRAFQNCTCLTSINIPQGVTSIGDGAFLECTGLSTISIPQGVTRIEDNVFYHCISLTSIDIPQGVTSIGAYAFFFCGDLSNINIPQEVTSIGNDAFSGCNGLTTISISQGVTTIDKHAFAFCTCLKTITIPESIKIIGGGAFMDCTSLTTINIPKGVISISEAAFGECTSLTNISVAVDNLNYTSINGMLFNKAGTVLIECPAGLKTIRIPQGVTRIGKNAFFGCTSLTSINIPEKVTSIGSYAFQNCISLTVINIPQGVTSIEDYTFYNCRCLNKISIPEGVTTISERAFYCCSGLTTITFNSAITDIYYSEYTIPTATKIIGYDPSTAKTYALNYNRTFEAIYTPDTSGMTEISTASSTVEPIKIWTIKLNGIVNESSLKGKIYVTNSKGIKQQITSTATMVNGLSQIEVSPDNNYTPGDYMLWVKNITSTKGIDIKKQVFLKFTVK